MTYNPQIENTISEIRKRSGAVTAFKKDEISDYMFGMPTSKFENKMRNSINIYQHRFLINFHIGEGYGK